MNVTIDMLTKLATMLTAMGIDSHDHVRLYATNNEYELHVQPWTENANMFFTWVKNEKRWKRITTH